jgi:threonine/homoserine/homoserine lactone efflux protein
MSIEFLLTSLIVVLMPGTGVIYTVSTGLLLGKRASMGAAIGCTLGIVPHLLTAVLGLTVVLHMSALAFQALKLAGAAYLLYLAWQMWRQDGLKIDRENEELDLFSIALKGLLINILNPKLSIFFLAFLPQFIPAESAAPLTRLLLLSTVFMLMTLVVFIIYGSFANAIRARVINSPRVLAWLQRGFAGMFAAMGMRLLLSEQK